MTTARRKLRERRQFQGHRGELKPMALRPLAELRAIQASCGGNAVFAALLGKLNAEEYLKLEQLSEH